MARIAKSLTELVGNTPLLEFSNFNASKNLRARVVGKLEYFNPAGSVKDRIALAMIEDAETRGVLKPGCYDYRTDQWKYRSRIGFCIFF